MPDPSATPQIADSLLDLVGDTPLLRLNRVTEGLACTVAAKLEMLNPGGSVKDRPALAMIEQAEREGALRPGGTIVEPTSGNTGVGLAIVAAERGYDCIFVVTDKVAPEKIRLLEAYGARVVVCPVAVEPDDPRSYYSVAERLVAETPGAFRPNQYGNEWNPWAHERSTGPEIWRQTAGRITHFVAGVGTGGTITGVSQAIKARKPSFKAIAVEPTDSPVLSGGQKGPHKIQGIGAGFVPDVLDQSLLDDVVTVSNDDAFETSRQLAKLEGIACGISSGAAVKAALEVARRPESGGQTIVVIIPSLAERYISTPLFEEDYK
jgi:cystathionine beta-synthase